MDPRLLLASDGAKTLVTAFGEGDPVVLFGDPQRLFRLELAQLANLSDCVVAGSGPFPWDAPQAARHLLLRCGPGVAVWVQVESKGADDGSRVMSMTPLGPGRDLAELLRLARLTLGASLLGPLAHEVNNLVQGMSSAEYLFRDCVQCGDPIEIEDLDQLSESVAATKVLGAEIQHFSRGGKGNFEDVPLQLVIKRAYRLLDAVGRLTTTAVTLEVVDALPLLHWRRPELEYVVLALLCNAADAAMEQGDLPKVGIRAEGVVSKGVEGITLSIEDSGPGLELCSCQLPFMTSKPLHRHLGIGLSTIAVVVAARGGHVSAVREDKVSRLQVFLPLTADRGRDEGG